jgi:hypothetical protein
VVEAIARGELDEELGVLGAVINERVRLLATARSMTTLASLRVGDRMRINHSAKPNYLHGRAGTVSGWAGQNVVVQLDRPVGRFTTGELRCPHSSSNHWHLNSYTEPYKRVSGLGGPAGDPVWTRSSTGEGKISGVELSISWLVVRLSA